MRLSFVHYPAFVRRWKEFRLDDEDLRKLELQLLARPEAGLVMGGTGGLRKMRFAPPSRHSGKSGAYRVCYVYFPRAAVIVLLAIFPKNQQENLGAAEKAQFRTVIGSLDF
jgi:hypothetical protein